MSYHPHVIHRFNKRWVLVALLACGQALVLLAGAAWLVHWLRESVSQIVRQRVMANTALYAGQIGMMIEEMNLGGDPKSPSDCDLGNPLSPGNSGWTRMQDLVEHIRLPYDGFLCIIDSTDGRVICHPDL